LPNFNFNGTEVIYIPQLALIFRYQVTILKLLLKSQLFLKKISVYFFEKNTIQDLLNPEKSNAYQRLFKNMHCFYKLLLRKYLTAKGILYLRIKARNIQK